MAVFRDLIRASLVLTALLLPSVLEAQQRQQARPVSAAPTAAQRQMQSWYTELQQIGARLQAAQMKAMQDPALAAAQQSLARDFKAAMLRADPGLAGLEKRAQVMEAEAQKAQKAGDQAKFAKLAREAQQIEVRLMNAQKKVMADEAFTRRARGFEAALKQKMLQAEPKTMELVERGKVLQAQLQRAAAAQAQAR